MEDKRGLLRAAVVCTHTLVFLLLEHRAARNAELRSEHAEFPSNKRVAVTSGTAIWHVKLETREVEADGLPNRLDIGLFQGKVDAQALEHKVVRVARDIRDFKLRELRSIMSWRLCRTLRDNVLYETATRRRQAHLSPLVQP